MNKKAVTKLFSDEVEYLKRNIHLVENLDTTKIYKIVYEVYVSGYDSAGVYHRDEKSQTDFIGKLKNFNKGSIKFVALGIQKVNGTYFEHELRKSAGKKEVPIIYRNIVSIEEWKNLETPQLEAAFIMNYEFMTQEMKQRCFNTK